MNGLSTVFILVGLFLLGGVYSFWKQELPKSLIVLGGAMLEEPIKDGVAPKMKGSVLMCVADTEEEVLERVKKDVYYTSDVWDKEKVSYCWCGWMEV